VDNGRLKRLVRERRCERTRFSRSAFTSVIYSHTNRFVCRKRVNLEKVFSSIREGVRNMRPTALCNWFGWPTSGGAVATEIFCLFLCRASGSAQAADYVALYSDLVERFVFFLSSSIECSQQTRSHCAQIEILKWICLPNKERNLLYVEGDENEKAVLFKDEAFKVWDFSFTCITVISLTMRKCKIID
jgi:hypothetical protein